MRPKGVHIFLQSISLKQNVLARVEFEVAFIDVAVPNVSNYVIIPSFII